VKLKHVNCWLDQHGKERCSLRLPGVKSITLPGKPGSPEFMAAYNAAVEAYVPPQADQPKIVPGTMHDLAFRYYGTARYRGKALSTRTVERQTIDRFNLSHGSKRASTIQTRHIDAIIGTMADRPAAAMVLLKRLRALFKLAIKLGWRSDDPTRYADRLKLGTHHTWTEDEIDLFHDRWPRRTTQRMAFDLLLYTGQRSGDVRSMTWADIRGGRVIVAAQQKTGEPVSVKIHPALAETLATHPRKGVMIVLTQYGRPFTQAGFGGWMADAIKAAELPDRCVPHGLRKAAARRLAEAGCTTHEIASITGHKSLKEVERYTQAANRAGMADAGMDKVIGMKVEHRATNPIYKPEK
jgi:enterobacteria phage integrase